MEDAVAEPGDRGGEEQPRERGREPRRERPAADEREPGEQDRARADAVDEEAGDGLHHAGHRVEHREHRAERGVAHAELVLEQREERRNAELEEVRQPVGDADQPDDAGVGPERRGRAVTGSSAPPRRAACSRG